MKSKLLYSIYDENTGISHVTILTKLGVFEGTAKLNKEEDKDIASNFAGCKLAESRAYIKYYKAKIKLIKEQINGIKHLENVLKNMKNYNPKSIENRKLRHQLFIKQSEINLLNETIKHINKNMDKYLENRIKYILNKEGTENE